ncbi:cytochrome b/b6 domain-containing protein [Thalassomonas haliotis]|uniref:Cytochrome b/b6 domain-containing protein n=1 Tax=Thalassomonas haliotis TaxID=485448 RepID=A0ABY7V8D8_9GAMM|nr:cytochrome b/b6 domain-containing protein [Thalassomonas haliotis]WDE09836.1 cytochrome b/b6 domain-containing protein [Thalassomonas haliotis]
MPKTSKHLIWDLPVRLFHWSFALTMLGAWYTSGQEGQYIEYHMQLGYLALGLLVFRISWGFIGPKHARFTHFVPSPAKLVHYLKSIKQGNTRPSPGHNPLGSLMVLAMITLVSLQAVSGLFISDDVFSSGPYYGSLDTETEQLMNTLHHNVFNYIWLSIGLHLLAIAYYWRVKKQNLVLPMITGKKSTPEISPADGISSSRLVLACVVIMATAAFVYWLVVLNAPEITEYYY